MAEARSERAAKVYRIFGETTTRALETIYEEVQSSFSELYREINNRTKAHSPRGCCLRLAN
jgi:hypothetical protein